MFKKDNDLCLKKNLSQCTLCQRLSSKAILYVCQSGHILCGSCHGNSGHGLRLDDGEGDCIKCKRKNNRKAKKEISRFRSHESNLACGDYTKNITKSDSKNSDDDDCINKDYNGREDVIVTYKNVYFQDCKSDTSTNSIEMMPEIDLILQQEPSLVQRPLACPVCNKIIALDSILQHFFFDHSKVSRYSLHLQKSQHTLFKISDLGEGTNCLAVILLEGGKRTNCPLLLMAAQIVNAATNDNRSISHNDPTSNIQIKSSSINPKKTKKNREILKDNLKTESIERSIDLIMWLCKTADAEVIYSLTVSREDKKMSYGYTGEATHLRDDQTGTSMFDKSEGVIVRNAAVKKIVNDSGYIHAFVTIIHF